MLPIVGRLADRAIAARTGRRYHERLAFYREQSHWPREKFQQWQWSRLGEVLEHAYDTVPFWREAMESKGLKPAAIRTPQDLRALPMLTKAVINAERERLISKAPPDGPLTYKSTGGSTGTNVWFFVDRETHDCRRAAGRLFETWDGIEPGSRVVSLWGASLETKQSRASRIYDLLANRLFLSVYGVDDAQLGAYFDKLDRFQPEAIVTYPSILLHIGRRMGRERCRRIGARVIFVSAEALFEPVREELEELFGAKVRNRYAAREFGMMAGDCPDGEGLYLAEMRMFFELIKTEDGSDLSELVVTDLDARAMPMIRYRIEDLGALLEGDDPDGRPYRRLSRVDGRSMDVVVTPEGRAFGGTFFTLIFRPFDQSILQFQAIQDAIDHVDLRIVPGPSYDAEHRAALLATLREQFGPSMRIDLSEHEEIPRLASGKRRFVVSTIGARAERT